MIVRVIKIIYYTGAIFFISTISKALLREQDLYCNKLQFLMLLCIYYYGSILQEGRDRDNVYVYTYSTYHACMINPQAIYI